MTDEELTIEECLLRVTFPGLHSSYATTPSPELLHCLALVPPTPSDKLLELIIPDTPAVLASAHILFFS